MKKIIYAILTTMLLATGCSESWLDPDPLSFYSPGNTLIDKEGMLSSVTACDRLLREEFVGQHSPILTAMIFSEQCVLGTTDISGPAQNLNEKILPTANNNWDQTNRMYWYWTNDYLGIRYANTVITRIDDATYESESISWVWHYGTEPSATTGFVCYSMIFPPSSRRWKLPLPTYVRWSAMVS